MTLPRSGPGRPHHPDLTGRTPGELGRVYCTCETRLDPGCAVHGVRSRRRRVAPWAVCVAAGLGFGAARILGLPF
jgi:hypothetical protein